MHLLVVRHAQPIDEAGTDGIGDPPLSELGLRQAAAIGEFLRHEEVDHIVSSPMVRAHQTAQPLAEHLGMDIEFDDDLKEAGWNAGPYLRSEENLQRFIDAIAKDPDHLYQPEGRAVFTERVLRSFTRIANENSGRTVAVFCHGMVTATFVAHVVGVEQTTDMFTPEYTALTRVQASPSRDLWSVRSMNEHMHLQSV